MNTRATQPNNMSPQQSLEADIDTVFGPMNVATDGDDNDEADAGDDAGSDAQGNDGAQRTTKQATDGEAGADGETDPFAGLAERLKGPPPRDANGNLLDKDGKIIAQTREERREVYNFNRLRGAAEKIKLENDTLRKEMQQLSQIRDMPGKLGLSLDQTAEAMEFRARLESDPVTTVRDIVARVLGNGYTMEQLFGADAPGYINSQMMKQQLDTHMRPLNERLASEQREERIRETAQRDLDNFVEQHEYADVHGEAIASMVAQHGIPPEKAYYELRLWAQQNGFDFTKPIREQIVAKLEARNNAGGGQQQQQPQRRTAPSTPGGTRVPSGAATTSVVENQFASPETSYRDIVAGAMRSFANGDASSH